MIFSENYYDFLLDLDVIQVLGYSFKDDVHCVKWYRGVDGVVFMYVLRPAHLCYLEDI